MDAVKIRNGTSPRTRGKRKLCVAGFRTTRNIPAYAGKTLLRGFNNPGIQEHPRARGENKDRWKSQAFGFGTSPRTRGKPGRVPKIICHLRNIPAHAGKTPKHRRGQGYSSEHPRARGENGLVVGCGLLIAGTSPRTRGKLFRLSSCRIGRRNIPAHAGKTLPLEQLPNRQAEHPRARGENSSA